MRKLAVGLAVLLLTASLVPPPVAANEPPLADAGLDQTVQRGTTVHLDASGSRDPDGSVDSYEWSIRSPDGGTTIPDCPTCARTRFVPDRVGTYDVSVTVTDDEGATTRDTLFVHVVPGEPPTITVAGPTEAEVGTALTYTGSLEAGTAPLEEITWRVDDRTVRVESVAETRQQYSLPYTFESTGFHEIAVTITDADGLSATDSVTVQVDPASSGGNVTPVDDGDSPGSPGEVAPSLADRLDPVVRGTQLLTGTGPFTEPYRLDVDPTAVAGVTWWRDGFRVAAGSTTSLTWSPGKHTLYGVVEYTDGSVETARFQDGTTDVEVDPTPRIELRQIDGFGSLTGVLRATDGFENLHSVSVSIDGMQVASKTVDPLALRSGPDGARLDLSFNFTDINPGETHRVVLRARDARGQVAETVETVEAVGIPEVISSEFVNGPVDSYHPRLDPERYTAKHVLKVKLNGVEPGQVIIKQTNRSSGLNHHGSDKNIVGSGMETVLNFTSYWSGDRRKLYNISNSININNRIKSNIRSSFSVTLSPPEARVKVISDGTPEDAKANWGLIVDASRSFDPDGTDLKFHWQDGAKAISEDGSVAKFESFDINGLVIEDGDDQLTTVPGTLFLRHFVPPTESVVEVTEGPYRPNESVTFEITTGAFELPKLTYYDDTKIGLDLRDDHGRLDEWGCTAVGPIDRSVMDRHEWSCEILPPTENVTLRGHHFYRGTVTFEASAFVDGDTPNVYLYNENTPNRSARRVRFPDVTVLEKGDRYVSDVEILNASYLVEEPVIVRKETPFESVRDQYLSEGFTVERTEMAGTEYTLEERVKVQDAEYETEERTFDSRAIRNTFIEQHPEWERGETRSELRRWTTTEQEWRSSRSGPGEFTGSTRLIEVQPPTYRYENQYRHYYTVERTGTRTVTRRTTVRVPVTRYRTERICVPLGCYIAEVAYTEWVTRIRTYTTTETYTYTVTESSTYWSTNKLNADDEFTGRTRKVEVQPAEYERQYLYEYEETHEEWVWYYTAQKETLVQPAEYEWREYRTTKSEIEAESAALNPDVRIGGTASAKVWFLAKRTGTDLKWVDSPTNTIEVSNTRAVVNESVTQSYVDPRTDEVVSEDVESRVKIYPFSEYLTRVEIARRILYESRTDTEE